MKHEWKKQEKELYGVKNVPGTVKVPEQRFIMIDGKGNPNDQDFSDRVSALYSLSYGIKMSYKAVKSEGASAEDISDFAVYPLEGIWRGNAGKELIKEELEYTIMIRQPDFISREMVNSALGKVRKKKPSPLLDEIRFDSMEDGLCVEILHTGPFDDEPESFKIMDEYALENGLKRTESWHREIYLNNANRVPGSKLKTILRYKVKAAH